jgi:hypothetical protein
MIPNLNVNGELDLKGADRALDELTRKANAFGGALSTSAEIRQPSTAVASTMCCERVSATA